MRAVIVLAVLVACGTHADRCVDPIVCDRVMEKYEVDDFVSRASAVFEHEGVSYHFVEIGWASGANPHLSADSYVCEIWDAENESGTLFDASFSDIEDERRYLSSICRDPSDGPWVCEWPGYESPLVQAPEFRNYGTRQGFMKGCREAILQAQLLERIPGPVE